MIQQPIDEKEVFNSARRIPVLEERVAYVKQVCGHEPQALQQILEMLNVYFQESSFLESPAVAPGATIGMPVEKAGTEIGPYKLLEQIGEGGMGLVFQAEQMRPVRRRVALKIIKPGMDSKQVIVRFEAERQALALMDHANIARVFEAGTTDTGRPYFVMELVRGIPITDYCDQHKLTIRQRLELFTQVCQAVQHAHQKGIIHRDLKPTNVLVAHDDTVPIPKVIDFGIAKATGQSLTDSTLFTAISQVVGTPRYMSPEQAALNHLDVDTRSDVYSLGVLLYELLTGTTPFDDERLRQLGLDEVRRVIREEEPPRPSTRVSTLGAGLTTVSQRRGIDPRRMSVALRGELDWIVMMALEKDRNRRYETASAFAADVRRYLADEPVQACPPSTGYRLRKFARRNKAALTTTALLVLMLLAAVGAIGWGVRNRTALEQDRATRQVQLHKETSDLLAEVARQRGEIHAKLAHPINVCELLSKIDGWHDSLAKAGAAWQSAKSLAATNEDVMTAELAERLQQVDEALQNDEADWKTAKKLDDIRLGVASAVDVQWNLNTAAPKYEQCFRDLGLDWQTSQPEQIASQIRQKTLRYVLVGALDDWAKGSRAGRARYLETARLADPNRWRDQVRQEKNWDNLRVLESLAREVDPANQSPQILTLLADRLVNQKGDARALLCSALLYYPQDFWLHFTLGNVNKDPEQMIGCFRAALAVRPTSSPAHINLGYALSGKKDLNGAILHYRKALELNPRFATAHNNLGFALREKKDLDGAIRHFRIAINLKPKYDKAHNNLARVLRDTKDLDGIIRHFSKMIDLIPDYALFHNHLGLALLQKKDVDGAIRHYQKAIDLDPNDVEAHRNLGNAFSGKKELDGAIRHYQKAIDLNPNDVEAHIKLSFTLMDVAHFAEALKHYKRAHELGAVSSSNQWVKDCERLVKLDKRLPAVLKGDVQPANPEEWLGYVEVCQRKKTHTSAVQLWNQFFLKHATLAENRQFQEKPEIVVAMAKVLQQWQKNPDLANVRDEQNLAKLPEEERKSWQKLWTEVEQLRKQADSMFKETTRDSGMVTVKERQTVREVKLQAGTTYVIDLESTAFDTFLVLMDAKGKKLAEHDDIEEGVITNSRLIFTPPEGGTYRVAASAFQASGTGPYTLTIREFVRRELKAVE